jgi:hypothetical protein
VISAVQCLKLHNITETMYCHRLALDNEEMASRLAATLKKVRIDDIGVTPIIHEDNTNIAKSIYQAYSSITDIGATYFPKAE